MKKNLIAVLIIFLLSFLFVGVRSQMTQATHRSHYCTTDQNDQVCHIVSIDEMSLQDQQVTTHLSPNLP